MTTGRGSYGGWMGDEFDDGVNDDVRKVIVGEDSLGVVSIKIEYVKDGNVVSREHGRSTGTQITETDLGLEYPDEYITSIWGTHGLDPRYHSSLGSTSQQLDLSVDARKRESRRQVMELQLKTSYGRTSGKFGKPGELGVNRTEFVLEGKEGTKLVGLHGYSGDLLDSISAYFVMVSSVYKQVKPHGVFGVFWDDVVSWDDGVYDGVKKVRVGEDSDRVSFVEFEYAKGEQSITHSHGKKPQELKEFLLDYENGEYIKSVEGTYNEDGFVSSLTFITSIKKDSEEFGKPVGKKFVIEAKGFDKLVGFRGRSSLDRLIALGANFKVLLAPPVRKLEAQGGDFGDEWDDGIHYSVRKIIVTTQGPFVRAVKFEYVSGYVNEYFKGLNKEYVHKRYKTVDGDEHGCIDEKHDKKEFLLWYGTEYITSIEGHYGKKLPLSGPERAKLERERDYITMLTFKTNLGEIHKVLGSETPNYEYVGTSFVFEETDHKIVGFHGKSTYSAGYRGKSTLEQIGVYVKPIDDDDA